MVWTANTTCFGYGEHGGAGNHCGGGELPRTSQWVVQGREHRTEKAKGGRGRGRDRGRERVRERKKEREGEGEGKRTGAVLAARRICLDDRQTCMEAYIIHYPST